MSIEPKAYILPVRGGARGFISFVHDDGDMPTCIYLSKLFEKHGLCGSIAFISNRAGVIGDMKDDGSFDITVNEEAVKEWRVFLREHPCLDIINHSYTHRAWGMDKENILRETVASAELLRRAFPGQHAISFAYPGFADDGTRTAQYKESVKYMEGSTICARGLTSGTVNPLRKMNSFYLATNSTYQVEKNTKNDKWIRDSVDTCCGEGGFMVVTSHCITEQKTEAVLHVPRSYYTDMVETVVVPRVRSGELCCTYITDAVQYLHEAENSTVSASVTEKGISVSCRCMLEKSLYFAPLTVSVELPYSAAGKKPTVRDADGKTLKCKFREDGRSVIFDMLPSSDLLISFD